MPRKNLNNSGGGFFSPEDHLDDLAVVIDVNEIELQVKMGNYDPKDLVKGDVAAFATQEDVDNGDPEVTKGVLINQSILAKQLIEAEVGNYIIGVVRKETPKNGGRDYWCFRAATPDVDAKVEEWAEGREAAFAAARESAPSFD